VATMLLVLFIPLLLPEQLDVIMPKNNIGYIDLRFIRYLMEGYAEFEFVLLFK
jgi:hypothetical protein